MKKRISALFLVFCLLLTTPALAAPDSTENFVRANTYAGQFSDLPEDSVFYGNVAALYEYGLSVGKGDGTYGLTDSLSVGQAVIFAGRIRSLYRTGDPEAGPAAYQSEGLPAALPYLLYLQAEGVLDNALDDQLSNAATRAQMAHVLANILPEEALPPVHDALVAEAYATRRAITDVTEYTPYYQDILALYRKGVSVGSDETGSFLPDQPITRGAVAAMLTRMVDPALRVTPAWDLGGIPSAEGTTFADLVTPGTFIADPDTEEEMDEVIRHMLASGSSRLNLTYPGISAVRARRMMDLALATVKKYCEQSYNSVACTFTSLGSLSMEFSAACAEDDLQTYRDATMDAAIAIHDQLWEAGILRTDMTELERALVYYIWICENCVYDDYASDTSFSHIAYGLFANGAAVCDGYTGAYNLLLKLEGIDCYALSNDGHIWTVATLDGEEYHIDTTWGDGEDGHIYYQYFAMSEEESWYQHPW